MAKRLIVVHGRSTKPRREVKERAVRDALIHGLQRVDAAAAEKLRGGAVVFDFAYYGDLSNAVLVEAKPELRATMNRRDGEETWFEPDDCYIEPMRELFARPTDRFTKREYEEWNRRFDGERFKDDVARFISPILANGLSARIIRRWLPDLGLYITSRRFGSQVRQRLHSPLLNALEADDDVAIVSHSMGCIATYDVLWKFSRMSEYETVRQKKVALWLTLGSPLGEPSVRQSLYDAHEPPDGLYPANVLQWINIAAHDDFVAHDGTIEDDFREMKTVMNCSIVDLPRIYTFWVNEGVVNPHKLFGYLDHPVVAQQIAAWLRG